jgi:hypothetical protein
MRWKKLLQTNDLIAYEKICKDKKVRLEARFENGKWRIYKTYNFENKENDSISHVQEYIASSLDETQMLIEDLILEKDISLGDLPQINNISLDLKRIYKEEFVEKWKFKLDESDIDNFIVIRYDETICMDVILHDKYNCIEKTLLEKLIESLGLKDISQKIQYDFFYFKKRSAKRRIYRQKEADELIAHLEFKLDS